MTSQLAPDWQTCDDILKCNQMMLEHQIACDITFLLGKDVVRQGAHRYILISRSPVFDAMLRTPLGDDAHQTSEIILPDIEPFTFHLFLGYLYYGHADITSDTVINLLYCAKKYVITGLVTKCLAYVEDVLDPQNACALLEQSHFFDEREFHDKVKAVVLRKAEEVLKMEDVTELCETCLSEVVADDNLMASEDLVLEACTKWAGAECRRRGLGVTDSNCRIILGNTLYKIRFPLLAPSLFVNKVAGGSLLSDEEKVDVMGLFIVSSRKSSFFQTGLRAKQRHQKLNRFKERHQTAFNNRSGTSAISFQVNRDIFLEGFTMYGACKGTEQEIQVKGQVLDSHDVTISSVESQVVTTGKQDIYDVMFDQVSRLHQGITYTLLVEIQGPHTFAGQGGRLSILCDDVLFAFSHSDKSQTGTTVTHGQLPGLIFSK